MWLILTARIVEMCHVLSNCSFPSIMEKICYKLIMKIGKCKLLYTHTHTRKCYDFVQWMAVTKSVLIYSDRLKCESEILEWVIAQGKYFGSFLRQTIQENEFIPNYNGFIMSRLRFIVLCVLMRVQLLNSIVLSLVLSSYTKRTKTQHVNCCYFKVFIPDKVLKTYFELCICCLSCNFF